MRRKFSFIWDGGMGCGDTAPRFVVDRRLLSTVTNIINFEFITFALLFYANKKVSLRPNCLDVPLYLVGYGIDIINRSALIQPFF